MLLTALLVGMMAQAQPPVPQPFPRPGAPTRPAPATPAEPGAPAPDTAAAPAAQAPDEATLGLPVYPGAQFLTSYDAGRGQRFYLFGSTASFAVLVTYYRTLLRTRGELVFEVPATHQFDIGRFREDSMAFPPSVTIKDFQSETSKGYPNPDPAGTPDRFPTIIQIVPAPPGTERE